MATSLFIMLIAAFSGFAQGLAGVGMVLISLPFMALFLPMQTIIPLVTMMALSINLVLGWQLRQAMRRRALLPLVAAALAGIPVGVYGLKHLPSIHLQLALGLVLVAYALYALAGRQPRREIAPGWGWLTGFLAGCLGGSIVASGPVIIVYTSMQPWPKDTIKSTMIGFFLASTLAVTATHAALGLITPKVLGCYAASLPGLALGGLAGVKAYGHIDSAAYHRLMVWLVLVLGAVLLWKSRAVVGL